MLGSGAVLIVAGMIKASSGTRESETAVAALSISACAERYS